MISKGLADAMTVPGGHVICTGCSTPRGEGRFCAFCGGHLVVQRLCALCGQRFMNGKAYELPDGLYACSQRCIEQNGASHE